MPTTASPTLAPDERATARWLGEHRPELSAGYAAALPGARAAVLARLWGGYCREPVPGIAARYRDGADMVVILTDRRRLSGPATAGEPFAGESHGGSGRLSISLDGRRYREPGALLAAIDPPGPGARLAAELDNSVANLALARAAAAGAPAGQPPGWPTVRAGTEQLRRGRPPAAPVLPHPHRADHRRRARLRARAPPGGPAAPVAVPADRWPVPAAGLPPVLPVHPWQRERLRDGVPVAAPTPARPLPVRPLMSLRTLAPPAAGPRQDRRRRADDQRGADRLRRRRPQRTAAVRRCWPT